MVLHWLLIDYFSWSLSTSKFWFYPFICTIMLVVSIQNFIPCSVFAIVPWLVTIDQSDCCIGGELISNSPPCRWITSNSPNKFFTSFYKVLIGKCTGIHDHGTSQLYHSVLVSTRFTHLGACGPRCVNPVETSTSWYNLYIFTCSLGLATNLSARSFPVLVQ